MGRTSLRRISNILHCLMIIMKLEIEFGIKCIAVTVRVYQSIWWLNQLSYHFEHIKKSFDFFFVFFPRQSPDAWLIVLVICCLPTMEWIELWTYKRISMSSNKTKLINLLSDFTWPEYQMRLTYLHTMYKMPTNQPNEKKNCT